MGLVSSWNYKRKPLLPLMATKAFCKKKHILGNWYMEEILIIEDDELLNDGLCFHLQKAGLCFLWILIFQKETGLNC